MLHFLLSFFGVNPLLLFWWLFLYNKHYGDKFYQNYNVLYHSLQSQTNETSFALQRIAHINVNKEEKGTDFGDTTFEPSSSIEPQLLSH